jgi:glycosyltransferase involved in cell wall biosynthesis
MTLQRITWVVPCFNEAARLDPAAFLALADLPPSPSLVFVDDGSRDQTLQRLRALAEQRPEQIAVVAQPTNQGKAEAVRQGLLHALAGPADIVGFVDADLATPPAELQRLAEMIRSGDYDLVLGSRVQLLGRSIQRNPVRHYLGRVFATCASLSLGLAVYDSQCGAKLFRRGEALTAALAKPFGSRWAFDVELLGRMVRPGGGVAGLPIERIREEPLAAWSDVPGSKLGAVAALQAGLELARIGWSLRRRR